MISDICFCFVILLLKHNLACDDVNFFRDEAVTGYKSDTSSLTLANNVIKQSECAIYCYNTAECQSFFYNKGTWTCRLHSSLFRATDASLVSSAGEEYFRRKYMCFVIMFSLHQRIHVCFQLKNWYVAVYIHLTTECNFSR